MKNYLKEERLKFTGKQKPHAEADSYLKAKEALFVKPVEVMIVNVTEGVGTKVDQV